MPKSGIPSSWLGISPVGNPIPNTRLVSFKAPMDRRHFQGSSIDKKDQFTPEKLVEILASKGKRLGLVIDLSSNTNYYDPTVLKQLGVPEYVKLKIRMSSILEKRQEFVEIVKGFLERTPDPNVLVGVHCLHGVNRTGYLVCSYLISELGYDTESAIRAFESARGHEIDTTKKWLRQHSLIK